MKTNYKIGIGLGIFTTLGIIVIFQLLNFKFLTDRFFVKDVNASYTFIPDTVLGNSRGYTTTPQELIEIKAKADLGIEPYASSVNQLFSDVRYALNPSDWPYGTIGGEIIESGSLCGDEESGPVFLESGGEMIYAKAMAYHMSGNEAYAISAREKILDLVDSYGYGNNLGETSAYSGANNCILGLSWGVPEFIVAADLLEDYPGWTLADKQSFQGWLANVVYKKAAWASRFRNNNWGSGGSYAAAMIADYLHDSNLTLTEVKPLPLTLTPTQAYYEHTQMQFDRMDTTWVGDSQCLIHGIQTYGGIPDELRRGTTGCTGQYLLAADLSREYTATHFEGTIPHAEMLLRRGDKSMYEHVAGDGSGSILKGILFVIDNPINPTQSFDWVRYKKSSLHIANKYYKNPSIEARLTTDNPYLSAGNVTPHGKITHAVAVGENPGLPPTVPPLTNNLVQNPSCEFETNNWIATNSSLISATDSAHSGSRSCLLTWDGVDNFYGLNDEPDTINSNLVQGDKYQSSAWVRSDSALGKEVILTLKEKGGLLGEVVVNSFPLVLTNVWQEITMLTEISASDSASLELTISQNSPDTGNNFMVDDVSLEKLPPPTPTPTPTPVPTPTPTPAPVQVFFDNFQSGSYGSNWTESNEFDWKVAKFAEKNIPGYSSSNKVSVANACTSALGCILTTTNNINLSGYQSAALMFWRYVDDDLDSGEFLKAEVFNGTDWVQIFNWTNGAGDTDTWTQETYNIPAQYLINNFKIRFTSKESSSSEDTQIDDVLITAL